MRRFSVSNGGERGAGRLRGAVTSSTLRRDAGLRPLEEKKNRMGPVLTSDSVDAHQAEREETGREALKQNDRRATPPGRRASLCGRGAQVEEQVEGVEEEGVVERILLPIPSVQLPSPVLCTCLITCL
ncbi:hypothetical protein EYF80_053317 [Liparis tanakae]|uniref:Uncharacterized protein n=1 Tax=Liparis tanakae TaxID=230148 RepID=A0A4Z2F883_9TELE|nr:hypothetical protein EYF80_053317 [Liparis tanakae]